jgi:hypothetical protein
MLLPLLDLEAAEHKVADMLALEAGIGRQKSRGRPVEEALELDSLNIEAHYVHTEQKRLLVESIENRAYSFGAADMATLPLHTVRGQIDREGCRRQELLVGLCYIGSYMAWGLLEVAVTWYPHIHCSTADKGWGCRLLGLEWPHCK